MVDVITDFHPGLPDVSLVFTAEGRVARFRGETIALDAPNGVLDDLVVRAIRWGVEIERMREPLRREHEENERQLGEVAAGMVEGTTG